MPLVFLIFRKPAHVENALFVSLPVVLLQVASIQVDSREAQIKSFALSWRNIHAMCFTRSRSYDYA